MIYVLLYRVCVAKAARACSYVSWQCVFVAVNEVLMAQLDQLSKENAKLKTELSQIKVPTAVDG